MKNNNRGFTLIELMIVIAILGVLSAVAYPSYTSYVTKGNRADGIDSLLSLAGRMEEFYLNNDTYDGATINALATGTLGSNASSDGLYTLAITAADGFTYTLTAAPVKADAECANLTLTSLGVKGTSAGTVANCW